MNTTKHTPGPWEIISDELNTNYIKQSGRIVAVVQWYPLQENNLMIRDVIGNAKLIAAAPGLLDMLCWYVDQFPTSGKITAAMALIKKATE